MNMENVINFLIGKKEGWTPIGKAIDKLDVLWVLPNEHRLSFFKILLLLIIATAAYNNVHTAIYGYHEPVTTVSNNHTPSSNISNISSTPAPAPAPKLSEEDDVLQNAKSVDYETLKSYKNDHLNEKVSFYGEVMQCQDHMMLLWDDNYNIVYVSDITKNGFKDISEDDHVTVYGYYMGLQTYTTAIGGSKKVPSIQALIVK